MPPTVSPRAVPPGVAGTAEPQSCLRRDSPPAREGCPWTPQEERSLARSVGYRSPREIGLRLGRTTKAVRRHAEKRGLRWRRRGDNPLFPGFATGDVARKMGVGTAVVRRWFRRGWLGGWHAEDGAGDRRPGRRPGAAAWYCDFDDLRRFVERRRGHYDPRRIADDALRAIAERLPAQPLRIPGEWLTTAEAVELLPYTRDGIVNLIHRGDLVARRRGRRWLVSRASIRAFEPPPFTGARGVDQAIAARRAATRAATLSGRVAVPQPVEVARINEAEVPDGFR